jgi:hypothetical protein
MKTRHKPTAKLSRTPVKAPRNRRRVVKTLAARGYSGDVIAATLGVNKNHLRAEHALDLQAGREIKWAEKAAAAELSRKERERIEIITAAWYSDWYDAELGENLLFPDCRTLEEALERGHWTTQRECPLRAKSGHSLIIR